MSCLDKLASMLPMEEIDAALQFIQTYPPKDFNLAYFQICLMSGRIDEAADSLVNFTHKLAVQKGN